MNKTILPPGKAIILFDGVCNLCNGAIQWIIERDKEELFRYASLQSDLGKKMLADRQIDPQKIDSIVLVEPNVAYYLKSTAALQIGKKLGSNYKLLSKILLLIPAFIRDAVYDFIARNRYRWFGKKAQCWIPNPELQKLFLD